MQTKFNIFYSWQSDLNPKENRYLIRDCIKAATKKVKNEIDFNFEFNLDRDTKGKSGSPSIIESIIEKIRMSDIFICDISIVNSEFYSVNRDCRITPNPNVLIELGVAIEVLGWDRIICLNNKKYSIPEQLPFNIRGNRISTFDSRKKTAKVNLNETLTVAISSIISSFEKNLIKHNQRNYIIHDKGIYEKYDSLLSFDDLEHSITTVSNGGSIYGNYVRKWIFTIEILLNPFNHYINNLVQSSLEQYINELDKFYAIQFSNYELREGDIDIYLKLRKDINNIDEFNQILYILPKQLSGEDWPTADLRVQRISKEISIQGELVKEAYKNYILTLKKALI